MNEKKNVWEKIKSLLDSVLKAKEELVEGSEVFLETGKRKLFEFRIFLKRYLKYIIFILVSVIVIAIAFHILVTGFIEHIIMPLIGLSTKSGNWQDIKIHIGKTALGIGELLRAIIYFAIVIIVVTIILRRIVKKPEAPVEKTKRCPMCGEIILEVARKCKHCGTVFEKRRDYAYQSRRYSSSSSDKKPRRRSSPSRRYRDRNR